ncbi:DUF6086 family protein [Streptomyces sp. NPDC001941]|uniref:DUF6086 family protein n=1 Tax=Streptomyces sp. NPDC001941 TaxID=3154659 RepID=UPI003327677D
MGHLFECGGKEIWDPSNRPAELYLALLKSTTDVFDLPTGLTSRASDWHIIDLPEYGQMVQGLLATRGNTGHLYLCRMLDGLLPLCIALYEAAGGTVIPATQREREYLAEVHAMDLPMGYAP